jgi:hypothetical protein
MRNTLRTAFWRAAYQSLPGSVRRRYLADVERAEHWELALDAAVAALSRAKGVLAGLFSTRHKPRPAH